jgi:hypothetical protein
VLWYKVLGKCQVRVFKTKWFARFARKERISDQRLSEAVRRAEQGLIDADLGGGVIKQRIARPGAGRSGGYRALIAYRREARAVFLYGFAKSERDNVEDDELNTARDIAEGWLDASPQRIAQALEQGIIEEVDYEDKEKD